MLLVFYLATLFVLSVMPVSGPESEVQVDKIGHFAAYGLAAVFFAAHFSKRGHARTYLRSVVAASAYGLLMEGVQHFLPYRKFSFIDAAANAAGALVIGAAYHVWSRRRQSLP